MIAFGKKTENLVVFRKSLSVNSGYNWRFNIFGNQQINKFRVGMIMNYVKLIAYFFNFFGEFYQISSFCIKGILKGGHINKTFFNNRNYFNTGDLTFSRSEKTNL